MSWYFVDIRDEQFGPVEIPAIKAAWDAKQVDAECICWNESMEDWIPINQVPDLMKALNPPAKPARGPPPGKKGPPTGKAASDEPAGGQAAAPKKSALQERINAAVPAPQDGPARKVVSPVGGWKALKTPDGLEYYFNQDTGQTTWEKPEELMTEADREREGEWYWLEHAVDGFIPARKIADLGGKTKFETEDGQSHTYKAADAKKLERMYWTSLGKDVDDLVMLDEMNRPLIVYMLKRRFENEKIYTRIGTILVSMNPYKMLPLYTPQVIDDYIKRGKRILPPHVFEIADNAYQQLREHEIGQSIVISGESGAGKTECTKQCLQYLAEIAGSASNVEQRILLSNPILESFGNAKTVRNNNSSRFGKYMEIFLDHRSIFLDHRNAICGASITNYLLEKVRVVFQGPNERNYHIFYQLVRAVDSKMRSKLNLEDTVEKYNYLNQSGSTTVDGLNDSEEFREVEEAFGALAFTEQEKEDLFHVVAGVLALGNVSFVSAGDRKSSLSADGKKFTKKVAGLWHCTPQELEHQLLTTTLVMKGQAPITMGLAPEEANASRDAIAKFVYEKNFDWLVQRINKSIGLGGASKGRSIGILDIFGFEIFEQNQFEQLCINFANEKLQQFFNQHTFKKEEAVYRSEKIKFDHVEYIDNQPVLDLIEKKPNGILYMVDEELKMPKGTDMTLNNKMITRHAQTKEFSRVLKHADMFMVHHYAGDVSYDVKGFLEKNKDRLTDDTYDLLSKSKWKFLAVMFPDREDMNSAQKKATLGYKFMGQLKDLMDTLNSTEPHYIRCIKPNPNKAPIQCHGKMTLEQLTYSGVFEAVQIRKQGFPFRLTHEGFWQRYKCIFDQDYKWTTNPVKNCEILIKEMKQNFQEVQIGTSMVLYRAQQHRAMELVRNLAVEKVTIFIQKFVRQKAVELLRQRIEAARPDLARAVASKNVLNLDKAIEASSSVGFDFYELWQAKRMKYVFMEEKRLESVFQVLVQQDPHESFNEFAKEIAVADEIELNTPLANQARHIHNEAIAYRRAIDTEAEEQKTVLNELAMKDVIDRADAVGYTTPEVDHLRHLLFDTSEDVFVKMQLKAAVKVHDQERVIGKTIRLKELVFEKAGDLFRFKNYPGLYSQNEWASQKLLTFKRDELAASMLQHTIQPIHWPLTSELPKEKENNIQKMAVPLFKSVMGYMGDRKGTEPKVLAQEIIRECLQHKPLRDELYCQLIKQLTNNPNSSSVHKGWDLMLLCIAHFPPNTEMENYLEMFLRTKGNPPSKYYNLLHRTLYYGEKQSPPTDSEINSILSSGEVERSVSSLPREQAMALAPPPKRPSAAPAPAATRGGLGRGAPGGGRGRGDPPGGGRGGPPGGAPPGGGRGAPPGGAPAGGLGAPPGGAPPGGGSPGPAGRGRGAPPGGAGRGAPPGGRKAAAPAPAPKPEPQMDPNTEWHYIDVQNEQRGPVNVTQLREEWRAKQVDEQCLVWNPDMADWKDITTLPELKAYLTFV
eukprot:g56997.t1